MLHRIIFVLSHHHKNNYWVRNVSVVHRMALDKQTQRMNHAVHSDSIVHTKPETREVDSWFRHRGTLRPMCKWMCETHRWQSVLRFISDISEGSNPWWRWNGSLSLNKSHLFWVRMLPWIFRAFHQKMKSHNAAVDLNVGSMGWELSINAAE